MGVAIPVGVPFSWVSRYWFWWVRRYRNMLHIGGCSDTWIPYVLVGVAIPDLKWLWLVLANSSEVEPTSVL